ncbi:MULTISPECIES: ESX secretion-associated protein EspG [unclassified Amycolatopsis]|uniref:ESX secretion-associated protein EspG n=1 Tax=unclassified Amycolatopsis TaxID=2618356 RepID=UPI00106E47CD|nr:MULTISPECIES: ESX secretion-associated protein EspG [unclassified Amycolatopsis]
MRTTDLSLDALLSALKEAGFAEPHPVFSDRIRFVPDDKPLDGAVHAELSHLGLLDHGRFTDEFEDVLYALARADTEYVAHVDNQGTRYGVLVAVRGRTGVKVLCSGDRVRLKVLDGTRTPAGALVASLPRYRPARLSAFSLPQEDFQADLTDDRSPAARAVDALFQQTWFGVGEITVVVREPGRAEAGPLSYLDLTDGRVAFEVSGPEGNRYITVLPGEDSLLTDKIAALRDGLTS